MKSASRSNWLVVALALAVVWSVGGLAVADQPAAPEVSTFAPAKDLAGQVEYYLERLELAVESEEEYNDSQEKIAKDSNVLILVALALGLHDTNNQYQAAAPAVIKAAQQLAAAKDFASAKAGVAAVKAAAASTDGDPSGLKWEEKAAAMEELMEAVPLIHSKLKRYLRGSRFASKADETAGSSAVLAVIAQGSMANSGDTEKPDEVEKWYAFCVQMRDASAAVNAGIRAQDEAATETAMEALDTSCEDCHKVFHAE